MKRGTYQLKTHRKRRIQSTQDLITSSEATISSQASVYTNQSRPQRINNLYSQSGSQNIDQFDDFQDIISDEIDTLFITPEEERKIQNILEFARKGKINPKNAFQIPVRVIDPQVTESINMRFWKFASQLLCASMNIYDKRVENAFLDTHRMFDTLVRIKDKRNQPLTEQQLQQKNRKQRGQILQIQISQLGNAQNVSTYEIGSINCQQAQKINIKNKNNQFIADPMFNKRLQAFDSNTLKSLFLNVFETNQSNQVAFFNQPRTKYQKMNIQPKIQEQRFKIQELCKQQQNQFDYGLKQSIFQYLNIEIKKPLSYGQGQVFKYMDIMRKQNNIQLHKFSIQDFTSELKGISIKQFQNNEDYLYELPNQSQNDDTASVNTYNMDYQGPSEPQTQTHQQQQSMNNTNTKTNVKSISYSSNLHYNQFIDHSDNFDETQTMMTPWELEFRGQKLMKKKVPRAIKTEEKVRRERRGVENIELDFLDGVILGRKDVLKADKPKQLSTREIPYKDKFLVMNMNPYHQMHKKHHKNSKNHKNTSSNRNFLQPQKIQINEDFSQLPNNHNEGQFNHEQSQTPNMNRNEPMYIEQQINSNTHTQKMSNFSQFFGFQQLESRGQVYRSSTIKNIRQIKERIYQILGQKQRLLLSQLNLNLSSASILVLFLHLANQKDLVLVSLDEEADLEIFKKRR